MIDLWYVWVVGHFKEGDSRVFFIGVFTSPEKARAAAHSGCFIFPMVLDEAWALGDADIQNVEWVD